MGESWFHREFLTPRRLVFNILFYGTHFGLFAYGWHSQVCASFRRSGTSGS
jgi:NADPH oxidase